MKSDKQRTTSLENELMALVREAILDTVDLEDAFSEQDIDAETRLFGAKGLLDSLDLVNLIVDLEERVEDRYGLPVSIADERAMSRRRSPFLYVGTLAGYIGELLAEEGAHA